MNSLLQEGPRTGEGLIVLTMDESLVRTLEAIASDRPLAVIGTEADLPGYLLSDQAAAVAVIDTAATTTPISRLTERLAAQFPDLVLVVAGDSRDQIELSAQVTRGTVYRFLHKPASAQRVRAFVQAALRRHETESAPMTATRARTAPASEPLLSRSTLLFGAAAVILAVAGAMWFETRSKQTAAPPGVRPVASAQSSRPALPTADVVLEQLLDKADAALERGDWVTPPDQSALTLYREALQRDNGSARARDGLERIVERLLTNAERALQANRTDEAERLIGQVREIDANNARVAFIAARLNQTRAPQQAAALRPAASPASIDRAPNAVPASASLRAPINNAQQLRDRVNDLLDLADERIRVGALIEPATDNARFYIESALAIAPDDLGVLESQRRLAKLMVTQGRIALAAGNQDEGERWLAAASDAGASADDITTVRREVARARINAKAEAMARLAQLFNQRLAQGRLMEPASDCARFYLTQLERSDSAHPSTRLARLSLSQRLAEEARSAVNRGDYASAQAFVANARKLGVASNTLTAVERDLSAARSPQFSNDDDLISASRLERTRYVPPIYPESAKQRGLSGMVELIFTVTSDGRVDDVDIQRASPPQVFDEAAVEAVRKWRYRPYERNGRAVDQRVKLILRFAMD
jgi:TonB family protein